MATIVPFAPTISAPFQFLATLDGVSYSIIVTWNVFGKRFYLNIYTQDGTLILARSLVGSPNDQDISLVIGYFTSTLVFRQDTQRFEISP